MDGVNILKYRRCIVMAKGENRDKTNKNKKKPKKAAAK